MDAAYLGYVFLGTGLLMPWNAFLTAADYYAVRYEGIHVDRLITVCYLPINLIVLASFIHYHEVIGSRLRIVAGFIAFTIAVSAVPLLDMFPSTPGSLAIMLLSVGVCGIADGAAQGSLFGEAATQDPRYIQALIAGTAVSGVLVSFLRILTKAALPETPTGLRTSANLYFLVAALLCAACVSVYSVILPRLRRAHGDLGTRMQIAAIYGSSSEYNNSNNNTGSGDGRGAEPEFGINTAINGEMQRGNSTMKSSLDARSSSYSQAATEDERAVLFRDDHLPYSSGDILPPPSAALSYVDVAWDVRWFAGSLVFVYVVTLSIFPGVLAEDVSSEKLSSWYPVLLIAAFNCADCAGKWLPALPVCRFQGKEKIALATLARLAFVSAFHLAATRGAGPIVVGLLTLLLGLTNGLLSTLCFLAAPSAVEPRAAALCGNIMVLSLVLGLCIGAACGFLWLL